MPPTRGKAEKERLDRLYVKTGHKLLRSLLGSAAEKLEEENPAFKIPVLQDNGQEQINNCSISTLLDMTLSIISIFTSGKHYKVVKSVPSKMECRSISEVGRMEKCRRFGIDFKLDEAAKLLHIDRGDHLSKNYKNFIIHESIRCISTAVFGPSSDPFEGIRDDPRFIKTEEAFHSHCSVEVLPLDIVVNARPAVLRTRKTRTKKRKSTATKYRCGAKVGRRDKEAQSSPVSVQTKKAKGDAEVEPTPRGRKQLRTASGGTQLSIPAVHATRTLRKRDTSKTGHLTPDGSVTEEEETLDFSACGQPSASTGALSFSELSSSSSSSSQVHHPTAMPESESDEMELTESMVLQQEIFSPVQSMYNNGRGFTLVPIAPPQVDSTLSDVSSSLNYCAGHNQCSSSSEIEDIQSLMSRLDGSDGDELGVFSANFVPSTRGRPARRKSRKKVHRSLSVEFEITSSGPRSLLRRAHSARMASEENDEFFQNNPETLGIPEDISDGRRLDCVPIPLPPGYSDDEEEHTIIGRTMGSDNKENSLHFLICALSQWC